MEQTHNPSTVAVQDPTGGTDPQPAAVASQGEALPPSRLFNFEAYLEEHPAGGGGASSPAPAAVSNEGTTVVASEPAADPTAKPAEGGAKPTEGVSAVEESAGETPAATLSRRESERVAHEQRISQLEADVKTAEARGRQAIIDEQRADEERQRVEALTTEERADYDKYQRLLVTPRVDMTPEESDWLEERKWLVSHPVYQSVERHLRAKIGTELAQERETFNTQTVAFWDAVTNELDKTTGLEGVDTSKWSEKGHTWGPMAQDIYDGALALGASKKEAEMTARVEAAEAQAEVYRKEAEQLRRSGASGARAPRITGLPAGGPTEPEGFNPHRSWRQQLSEAVAEPASA